MRLLARLLVRWRWPAIVIWAIIGAFAVTQAPRTQHLLNLRGGSKRPTEASRVDDLLRERFERPLGEFLAVTISSPTSLAEEPALGHVITLQQTMAAQPYVRGVLSFQSTGDSTFLSRDGRTGFILDRKSVV